MDLALRLLRVTEVATDFSLLLALTGGAQIRIETTCSVAAPGSEPVTVVPGARHDMVETTHSLLDKTLARAATDESGGLRVDFTDGWTLRVPPDPHFEAWSVTRADGRMAVARPGGGMVTWAPAAGSTRPDLT